MENAIVIDTPEGIEMYFLLARKSALKLEILGLKNSRGSAYAFIKKTYGFKGNKQSVLTQLEALIASKMPKKAVA